MKNWMPPPPSAEEIADCNRYMHEAMKYPITEASGGGYDVNDEQGNLLGHFDEMMEAIAFVHRRINYERN